ncbi:hypothetical protein AVEN_148968-1 [Araneus ventricosus]|uniref:Uncharacterized protein n=1 Tax=Araneus ventricosus TaxID=182803 RepID=A0A4Y2S1H6_ARAVE|nr:hypothetical protein AVEN_148968-1 [Araneus ventricosus]
MLRTTLLPEPMEKGIIVLFHKDGKELIKIMSYRPVTLLSTIGKVLKQIFLRRFNHTLRKSIFHYANSRTPGHRRDHTAPHQSRTGNGLRQKASLRKASHYNNNKFNPNNYEDGTTSTKFHPAIFQLEDRISLKKQFLPVPGLNIYTDGSKMEDKTGRAFCIMEEDTTK